MEEILEEKALKRFSWYALSAVTAFSSFLFSAVLRFLEGSHSAFFLKMGSVSMALSFILWLLNRTASTKRRPANNTLHNEPDTFSGK